jgi:SNF2 family DNA or RNA helicase
MKQYMTWQKWIAIDWTGEAFFIWVHDEQNRLLLPELWRPVLFMRHKTSFYGLGIEEKQIGHKQGIVVDPLMALDLLAGFKPTPIYGLQPTEQMISYQRGAQLLQTVLDKGYLLPDYAAWQVGSRGWCFHDERLQTEVDIQLETEEKAALEQWLNHVMQEGGLSDSRTRPYWQRLQKGQAMLTEAGDEQPAVLDWLTEEAWLYRIGWFDDPTPFQISLQLEEPEAADQAWMLHIVLQDKADASQRYVFTQQQASLPQAWQGYQSAIEKEIALWCRVVPWLADQDKRLISRITEEQAWRLLTAEGAKLLSAGIQLLFPAWWERLQRLKPVLKAKVRSSVGAASQAFVGLNTVIQFDWKLAIGDIQLEETQLRELLQQKRRMIQHQGQWVMLDAAMLEKLKKLVSKVDKKGLSLREVMEQELLQAVANDEAQEAEEVQQRLEIELSQSMLKILKQLNDPQQLEAYKPTADFKGELRPYQQKGSAWLLFLRRYGLGACLADDMGLGKTIQMIAYLLKMKTEQSIETQTKGEGFSSPSLLICPTSVLGNWQKELQRFAPSLKVKLHYGPQRVKGADFLASVSGADVVLTSYGHTWLDLEELGSLSWSCLCLDEAQNIKNVYTKQAKAIRRLNATHRIALTGTPMENRLTELWSVMDFINPGYLGSLDTFKHRFVRPIEASGDKDKIAALQALIRPFLLRRSKKDPAIELDLPEKEELKLHVPLTPEQASLYEQVVEETLQSVARLDGIARKSYVLAMLSKLKQLCNHPGLYLKEPVDAWQVARSKKLEQLRELIEQIHEQEERCIIFTQYIRMGETIQKLLTEQLGQKPAFLHGGIHKKQRDHMIESFQAGEQHSMVLSLKAGGTGLNLTAANHVIHFDRWWNPAVENQATDRVHRIGQKKYVQVYKLMTLGTLEERIDEMIEKKASLNEQIYQGEQWVTELSTQELREFFMLRKEWVEG